MASALWQFVLGGPAPAGVENRQLAFATGRQVTWRIDGPCTAQFVVDGRGDEVIPVTDELAVDLWVYRINDPDLPTSPAQLLFRGRVAAMVDEISEDRHTVQCSAKDYRGMLADHAHVGIAGKTFTNVSQAVIPWTLIGDWQALAGGNWGITNGLGATSAQNRDRTVEAGASPGAAIESMGQLDNGFEWEISPLRALNRWYPDRRRNQGVSLDYGSGGVLAGVRRVLSPSDFANAVMVTGGETTTPVLAVAAGIATDPRGRWAHTEAFANVSLQSTLTARAPWLLARTSVPRPEWAVRLRRGAWGGPDHIWLGEVVNVAVKSGRLSTQTSQRVVEISASIDEDGEEQVDIGLVSA